MMLWYRDDISLLRTIVSFSLIQVCCLPSSTACGY